MRVKRKRHVMTLEKARELFRLDRRTGALYWRTGSRKGQRADTICKGSRYYRVCHGGERFQAHLIVWLLVHRQWPPEHELDHIDRKPWRENANRPSNLRRANRVTNNYNVLARSHNRSKRKWVRTRPDGKYQATVQLYLGTYTTSLAAHQAARNFLRDHHGEFFNPGTRT